MKWKKKHILYILFAYLLFQFVWWEILLVKLHHQNFEKEKQLAALRITDYLEFQKLEKKISDQQRKKIIMIVGEGTVFLILIVYGFYRLLKSYEKDIAISQRQTHFLLSLPHEIKTPLSVIQLNLQTLLHHTQLLEDKKTQIIQSALEELKRLQQLIDHLLLSNKISKDKYHLHLQEINLSEYIKNVVEKYPSQKHIEYDLEENVIIKADEYLLNVLLQNLLSNAVKFSEKYIYIHLYKKNNSVYLDFVNDGDLIDEKEKEHLFELFYRRKSDEQRGIKGTGLGLYIVKQIVDWHHFNISVFTKDNYNVFQVVF